MTRRYSRGLVPAWPSAVGRFLDGVDEVLNSNTLLLRLPWRDAPRPDALCAALAGYLRSAGFRADFRAQMLDQHWWTEQMCTHDAPRLVEPLALSPSPLTGEVLMRRLMWMLTDKEHSWYSRQLAELDAAALVHGLLFELLDAPEKVASTETDSKALARSIPDGWTFVDVAPNFLYSTGYFGGAAPEAPEGVAGYFDGSKADGCLLMLSDAASWMLLTNGSP